MGGEPRVVLENAEHWRALRVWDPSYLKAIAGATTVAVRETIGPPSNVYQNLAEGGRLPFAQYLDWVLDIAAGDDFAAILQKARSVSAIVRGVCDSGFERSYYLDVKLGALSQELLKDVQTPGWYSTDPVDVLLWCGVLGTSSGLHFDLTPNCNVQIAGHKHFILSPPSNARLLYRVSRGAHCRFDPNTPDFDRFPFARKAQFWRCTLQVGESLYIPAGWFHQVTVTSAWALNVNFFWPRPFPQGLITPVLWRLILRRNWARFRRSCSQKNRRP
jgi:Cupin-like domain